MSRNPQWIVPAGTQIVAHQDVRNSAGTIIFSAGSVGVIVATPLVGQSDPYRARFPDGTEAYLNRADFSLHRHFQAEIPEQANDLFERVMYRCVVGSRAYGLDEPESDMDIRGIFLPTAEQHWAIYGLPTQIERGEETYWELQKFMVLALKANPNVLECLYTPLVVLETPLAAELRAERTIFLSKLVYQTFNGYVLSQFRKLQHDLAEKGTIRWKHAMHLIRLLLTGIALLQKGEVAVQVEDRYREALLSIRRGELNWEQIDTWRLALHREFEEAFRQTKLPDRPDFVRANAFLLKARKSAL